MQDSGLQVPLVRRLEFIREFREDLGTGEVAGRRVVVGDVAAATAENLSDRRGGKVRWLGRDMVRAKEREHLLGVPEQALVKGVDEKGRLVGVAAHDEVARKADWLEGKPQPFGDEKVEDAERDRDPLPAHQ